ncbi:inactive serine protease PAMR1 isoform X4 [Pyrgilauda ruficollis]|uniref:inactive serine protease PAMR1 isoform X2 n=1 Tax=Onychostruthus taczanowskii TaxID=356909 RepID=UPI001B80A7F3|nr:inactive serine protease PAMR1 isoform X2 [Onychostruthus taczanowskii]XP_041337135.1 inactive serine protease PAMR1 isoform X4 [Pyrgilauda ruficollis]
MERAPWTLVGLTLLQLLLISCLPREYTVINENCPGAEWNIMCRECCEYDQIECICPGQKERVGYTIPCCRNEENECDSCLIHPGCTIFENCKSCRNGSWGGTLDDFYIKGIYCAECRAGWYGGDCMTCSSSPCLHDGTCILDKSSTYKCACLAGYTGNRCENLLEEKNCSDPGGPLNGYRRVVEDTGLLNGRYAKIGTVIAFFCNNSYVLSGNEQRTCQDDGEWSGKQPICIKACREPKISDLVRQKVLPMQVQSRETPLHQLYSSAFSKQKLQIYPTKKPALPFGELPPGYQHLHTQLQYECVSPFYRRLGSSRRTCLKTGKWSGRAPVCIPICGKAENITLKKAVTSMRWPWQAAIYRTASGVKENSLRKGAWILICSGALVNERTVVVAAHCVTDLGKTIVLKTAELKVVLGKFYRDDDRDEKTIQNLRISAIIVHPNYDPILLDSDIAVIKLLDKARISSRVQPICLSSSHDLTSSTEDLKIMVTGWKVLADIKDHGYKNDTIRMGVVQMVDSLLCEQQYEDNGIQVSITDSMFCAKQDHTAFSNICPAETGGIAAITLPGKASPELRWHLMGLVSWGYDKTCSLELYSGYTKALPFKDWIEKNMK